MVTKMCWNKPIIVNSKVTPITPKNIHDGLILNWSHIFFNGVKLLRSPYMLFMIELMIYIKRSVIFYYILGLFKKIYR